ncbi:MAG: farnesyl-diphosphate farnesyltransferase [Verrucomicrobiota bacterium]
MKTPRDFEQLRGPILRAVSRSFYLSLRALPPALRDPLSLAYLLARATDTIADTTRVPANVRMNALRNLVDAIQGTAGTINTVRETFAPLQSNAAERGLIDALPTALGWLDSLEERDRSEVRAVLEKINRGQTLDLERFGGAEMRALPTAADLDEYTYLVAGCVGEFWTRVCFAHVKDFSERPEAEMRELGVQYGKGLQLINILRDAGADLRDGRCYLPARELHSLGLTPEEILRNPARVEPIMRPWLEKAERGVAAGIDYACAIRPRRIRFATVLPALIGARTLALLREAGPEVLARKIKVSRAEVRQIVSSTALRLASCRSLRKAYRK